jgi:hypothetical protein
MLVACGADEHLPEMLVFTFSLLLRRINPVVNGVKNLAITVNQINHANPTYQTVFRPAVLLFHPLDAL